MPAPKSPVTLFYESMSRAALLKAARVEVLLGRDKLSTTSSPRRIVFWPTNGPLVPPKMAERRNNEAPPLANLELNMVALIWAENYDEAWDILQRFFQSMHAYTVAGGVPYLPGQSEDTSGEDTSLQGETIRIRFGLLLTINRASERTVAVEKVKASVTDSANTETITITG